MCLCVCGSDGNIRENNLIGENFRCSKVSKWCIIMDSFGVPYVGAVRKIVLFVLSWLLQNAKLSQISSKSGIFPFSHIKCPYSSVISKYFSSVIFWFSSVITDHRPLFPPLCSNIPCNMFYSSIAAEVLRIGRTSCSAVLFSTRTKPLVQRMIKQGAVSKDLVRVLKKTFSRHSEDLCHITSDRSAFFDMVLA